MEGHTATHDRPPARAARRRLLVVVALFLILLPLSLFALSRSAFVKNIALDRVESALGADASARSATLTLSGRLRFTDLALRVPSLDSPAADFLTADEALISLDLLGALSGSPDAVRAVELRAARIRLSQSPDLRLNIENLTPPAGATTGTAAHLPTIRVSDALLELGEHDAGRYTRLTTITVDGVADTDPAAPTTLRFSLVENAPPEGTALRADQPLTLAGEYDLATRDGKAQLTNVDLARWGNTPAPERFQQLWSALDPGGTVDRASIVYAHERGLSLNIELSAVNIDIPAALVRDLGLDATADGPIALRTVNGSFQIRDDGFSTELNGRIAELPVRVDIFSDGYTADTTFRATIATIGSFVFAQSPTLLPFAPRNVRDLFEKFASPTAAVEGSVSLARDTPGSPIAVKGSFGLLDGFVRYTDFPYPISNVTIQLDFDNDSITVGSISGRGPTGAQFLADGTIAPLGDDAVLTLKANLFELPLDDEFKAAVPDGAKDIIDQLMHRPSYDRLVAQGLLMPSAAHDQLAQRQRDLQLELAKLQRGDPPALGLSPQEVIDEIAASEKQLQIPVFDLAGTAELSATIRQTFGQDPEFAGEISGAIVRAGAMPEVFPYAAYLKNTAFTVDDWDANIEGTIVGLSGGTASLAARVPQIDRTDRDEKSTIRIDLHTAPIDDYFFAALPGPGPGATTDRPSNDPRSVAQRLGLNGTLSNMRIRIGPRPATNSLGFDVSQAFDGNASLKPPGSSVAVSLDAGMIDISEDRLLFDLTSGTIENNPVSGRVLTTYGSGNPTDVVGAVTIPSLDVGTPVESFFAAIAPDAVRSAENTRVRFDPEGVADVTVHIQTGADGRSGVAFANPRGVRVSLFDGRLALDASDGAIFTNGRTITFENITDTPIAFNDEPAGRISAHGLYDTDNTARAEPLRITLSGARVESPLTSLALRERSARLADWLDTHNARGRFDIGITRDNTTNNTPRAWLEPERFTIDRRGVTIPIEFTSGRLDFDQTAGRIDSLAAIIDGWRLDLSGDWSTENEGRVALDVAARGGELNEQALAALPRAVATTLSGIEFDVGAGFAIENASLRIDRAFDPTNTPDARFDATLRFNDASLRTGLDIDRIAGTADLNVRANQTRELPDIGLDIHATALRVQGVAMDTGELHLRSDPEDRAIHLSDIRLSGHGGSVVGLGKIELGDPVAGAPRTARLRFDAAGLAFSSFYNDLVDDIDADETLRGGTPEQTGTLEGSFSLETGLDSSDRAVGRGIVRIASGEFVDMPGVLPLLELSNLRIPSGERLTSGFADFFIAGNELVFEELEIASPSLVILGRGGVAFPQGALDLRFTTAPKNAIALLGEVLEGVRDEFVTSRLSGTLREPEWTVEQLPATRRFFATIFGSKQSEQEQDRGDQTDDAATNTQTGEEKENP